MPTEKEDTTIPIYEYKCFQCEYIREEYRKVKDRLNESVCIHCGSHAVFVISPGPKPTDHLYPRMVENFAHNPVRVNSLKHYREEQKKRGLVDNGKPRGVRGQWI
jgi:putative FmdB family regulatory protein